MSEQLKKVLFSVGVTVVTLALGLLVIWLLAPRLLGRGTTIPADIRLVRVDEKVPPFYEHIFDYGGEEQLDEYHGYQIYLRDPRLGHRPMPLLPTTGYKGPHDVLGFRNLGVPNRFDVMIMGDSQTYGANATFPWTWPSQMAPLLAAGKARPTVYNVSIGGWGAIHFYYLFEKMLAFEPKVVVIAHYMGNDSLECFRLVYANDFFSDFRPNTDLSQDDLPKAPKTEGWRVEFADKTVHVFTPDFRLICSAKNPVVDAGYEIMKEASRRISAVADRKGVKVIYTIIPTKEMVFAKKIAEEGIDPPPSYSDLVQCEQERIDDLASFFDQLPSSRYVGVLDSLRLAVMSPERIYRFNAEDGHPFPKGYGIIAKALAPDVREALGIDSHASENPSPKKITRFLHLPMDDNAANRAIRDASDGQNTQTFRDPSGTPNTDAHSVPGMLGTALAFDGVDDSIVIPAEQVSHVFAADMDFSVAFWWRSGSDPFPDGYKEILGNYSLANGGIVLYQRGNADGTYTRIYMNFYVAGNGAPVLGPVTDVAENIGQWHHYVFQREGLTLEAWRDGSLLGSYTDAAARSSTPNCFLLRTRI